MLKYLKLFEQFLTEKKPAGAPDFNHSDAPDTENDLHKIYLAINPKSGHTWWYTPFAAEKFMNQLGDDNMMKADINKEYPVMNWKKEVTEKLINKGLVKKENVYNLPENVNMSYKKEFHELVDGQEHIPKTVNNTKDALKLGFPLIGKPTDSHSGIGIQVFKNQKEWDNADHSELDVYSEYINKVAEYRFFVLNGKAFYWMEREPLNKKAASGVGNGKDKMMFKYIKKDITKLPNNFKKLILKFSKIFSKLPFICFDIMIDKDDKLYLIEANLHPGMPFDATVQLYRELFKDFYGREVNKKADEELNKLSKYLDSKTLTHDPTRFEIA